MKFNVISVLTLITLLPLTHLAAKDAHQHIQHGAHVHGSASLDLVLQGNALEMQLHSPAMNVVGFEHQAASAEEKQKLQEAHTALKNAGELFLFKGTRCRLSQVDSELKQGGQVQHSEFNVAYAFTCKDGASLTAIELKFAERFSGIYKLHVEWILDGKQGVTELTANSGTIQVK